MEAEGEVVKENVWLGQSGGGGLGAGGCCAVLGALALLMLAASHLDSYLPPPLMEKDLAAHPESFNAELAHEFLVNLTSIGPRVSGSYACDVLGLGVAAAGLRRAARHAGPHNTLDTHLHRSDGFFNLTFFDGMNNAYRGVLSVVGRVRARGAASSEPALLLNCHIDTVPDSPGASDDGAGCAVLAEVGRALAASPLPLPRPVILLFNAAEETIMQGSHSFVSSHAWAGRVRALVNMEACGAGGREVVFQAGAGWLLAAYRRAAPHPFASSLAQELFDSGLIPADTDYRVFRDFGRIPGLDMAWHADGYVYHTGLDSAARVPLPVLQRTGDNIRALANALIRDPMLSGGEAATPEGGAPVYFDIIGVWLVVLPPVPALMVALGLLILLALRIKIHAQYAAKQLCVSPRWWYGVSWRAAGRCGAAAGGGVLAAVSLALALHAARVHMPYYSHPALLFPLYMIPAVLTSAFLLRRGLLSRKEWVMVGANERAWWGAWALQEGGALANGAALLACMLAGLRSGFLPAVWLAADTVAQLLPMGNIGVRGRVLLGALGCSCAALQTGYLALSWLRTLVPIAGRAGQPPLPPDVLVAGASGVLSVSVWWCAAPLIATARKPKVLLLPAVALFVIAAGWSVYASRCVSGWPYSADTPQRLMIFHVTSSEHFPHKPPLTTNYYWVPQLDPNTENTLSKYVSGVERETDESCRGWVYCGGPYYVPVRSLVGAALRAPAPHPATPRIHPTATVTPLSDTRATITLAVNGTDVTQTVIIVSLRAGALVTLADVGIPPAQPPLPAKHTGDRNVYFFSLTDPKGQPWNITLHVEHLAGRGPGTPGWGQLVVGGHAPSSPLLRHRAHQRLLGRMPPHIAPTGWGAHLHLIPL